MKRKLLLTSMLLLLTGLITHAQDLDIKPSQQAQGILESKNGMVDHATGLFHYKVPLYEIKSGNFTLPISLNYVAKGVKADDKPGLVGYNWSLNTGGVITRTIRGGIADEDGGLAMKPLSSNPTTAEIELINKRERDGESDIFTASFNDQTVHFIIQKNADSPKLIAIPLQRTNVKIEIIQSIEYNNNVIDGWVITDDNGNKYTFMQKELTTNVTREGAIGTNGLNNKKFISSWYLTSIEPLNERVIKYRYLENVNDALEQTNINKYNQYSICSILYKYGNPILEHPFDFSKIRHEFNESIKSAESYIEHENFILQLNNQIVNFVNGQFMRNPFFEDVGKKINANFKIMGMLSDLSEISSASNEVIQILNYFIDQYGEASLVALELKNAKRLMIDCLKETVSVSEKEIYEGNAYTILTPLLSQIEFEDKFVTFSYRDTKDSGKRIDQISLQDICKQKIYGVKFNGQETVDKISFVNSQSEEYDSIQFEYYALPSDDNLYTDLWGYYKEGTDPDNDKYSKYLPNVDINSTKYNSLYKISRKSGADIKLDYESNQTDRFLYDLTKGFGGIRIKSLIYRDNLSDISDTIKYQYPSNGIYIYLNCLNKMYVGNDILKYNRIINTGKAWINLGNNGIYYPYVQEEFVGKGMNTYNFYMPRYNFNMAFPFWSCGIPIGKASYDVNNRLLNVTKYDYYDNNSSNDFENTSDSVKSIVQVEAYEYYMDKEKIETDFRNQEDITLYEDGHYRYRINPYNDVYLKNIWPRISAMQLPSSQDYLLHYGGRSLLKEQTEYRFENMLSSTPSEFDYQKKSNNVKKIEYQYDDIFKNIYPTKIIQKNSNGSKMIEVIKRTVDIIDNNSFIDTLKSRNMFSFILKTQKQIQRSSSNNIQLQEEKVYRYNQKKLENKSFVTLNEIHTYIPKEIVNIDSDNNNLFGYNISNYLVDKINYKLERGNYQPTYYDNIKDKTLVNYDLNNIIMKVSNIPNNSARAVDYRDLKTFNSSMTSELENIKSVITNILKPFYEKYTQLNFDNCSSKFCNYITSKEHEAIIKVIRNVVLQENRFSYEEFNSLTTNDISYETIRNFMLNYMNNFPPNIITVQGIYEALCFVAEMTEISYNNLYLLDIIEEGDLVTKSNIILTDISPNKNYKLYIISDGINYSNFGINYSINSEPKTTMIRATNHAKLSVVDIDLRSYINISNITVNHPNTNIVYYIALIPEDAEFEATSYNVDGTIFCKFNQNGQLERYEYDAAGRVIKIYDNDNNVLKEFNYNVVLPQ